MFLRRPIWLRSQYVKFMCLVTNSIMCIMLKSWNYSRSCIWLWGKNILAANKGVSSKFLNAYIILSGRLLTGHLEHVHLWKAREFLPLCTWENINVLLMGGYREINASPAGGQGQLEWLISFSSAPEWLICTFQCRQLAFKPLFLGNNNNTSDCSNIEAWTIVLKSWHSGLSVAALSPLLLFFLSGLSPLQLIFQADIFWISPFLFISTITI